MFEDLKRRVFEANQMLPKNSLVTLTWGNASEIDRENGIIGIKPSGVNYIEMTEEDIVLVDLNGRIVEGELKPSSDLPTHLELYKEFEKCGGVVHTHSRWATVFAQSKLSIGCFGTTHSDYFHGTIPCTRDLSHSEIEGCYEKETGKVIVESFKKAGISPEEIPGVLVASHGPFVWGSNAVAAATNAVVLEEIAFMNYHNQILTPQIGIVSNELLDKHYYRKHGSNAYYGQY